MRSKRIMLFSSLLTICIFVPALHSAAEKKLESDSARNAKQVFRAAIADADRRYSESMASARTQYLKQLGVAKVQATKAANLDEANAIVAEIKNVEANDIQARSTRKDPLVVSRARYGVGDRWVDATDLVRKHIKDGGLSDTNDALGKLPDPAVGSHEKQVEVEGTYGGVSFVLRGFQAPSYFGPVEKLKP